MLELLHDPQNWISLLVLTSIEVVLGIDNIVFITILSARLPVERQAGARRLGLAVALVSRLVLIGFIGWILALDATLFTLFGRAFSWKDLILIGGGLFLLAKATHEIYENVERPLEHQPQGLSRAASPAERDPATLRRLYSSIIFQVLLLDMVFSIDSVITAVGLVDHVAIMVAAMLVAVAVMFAFAGPVGEFIQKRPSVRVLALAFLVMIGTLLLSEGFGVHFPKGYVYFAMAFSLGIELLNSRMKSRIDRMNEDIREAVGES